MRKIIIKLIKALYKRCVGAGISLSGQGVVVSLNRMEEISEEFANLNEIIRKYESRYNYVERIHLKYFTGIKFERITKTEQPPRYSVEFRNITNEEFDKILEFVRVDRYKDEDGV